MKNPRMRSAAVIVLGTFAGACADEAQSEGDVRLSPFAPVLGQDTPGKPEAEAKAPEGAQRPIDEGAIRALAEELARLRAELADLKKQKAAANAAPDEPADPVAGGAAPAPATAERRAEPAADESDDDADVVERVVERETFIEREVPVYVDREVPVYVDREVIVETEPTVILQRITYGDVCCDQWIPRSHVHFIGCGHHYYGCHCHPWFYDLAPSFQLSFAFVHDDHHGRGGHARPGRDSHHGRDGGGRDHDGHDRDRDRHDGDRSSGHRDGRDTAGRDHDGDRDWAGNRDHDGNRDRDRDGDRRDRDAGRAQVGARDVVIDTSEPAPQRTRHRARQDDRPATDGRTRVDAVPPADSADDPDGRRRGRIPVADRLARLRESRLRQRRETEMTVAPPRVVETPPAEPPVLRDRQPRHERGDREDRAERGERGERQAQPQRHRERELVTGPRVAPSADRTPQQRPHRDRSPDRQRRKHKDND